MAWYFIHVGIVTSSHPQSPGMVLEAGIDDKKSSHEQQGEGSRARSQMRADRMVVGKEGSLLLGP